MNEYYEKNAIKYIEDTINCDMSFQYEFLLKHVEEKGKLLDIGFGSGRDMRYFKSLGFDVYGIDPTEAFISNATDLNVKKLYAEELKDNNEYNVIWACASLLHCTDLILSLNNCYTALKKNGIMYASFKYGDFEGIRNERHFIDVNEEKLKLILSQTKFELIDTCITHDVRKDRNEEKWINIILKK